MRGAVVFYAMWSIAFDVMARSGRASINPRGDTKSVFEGLRGDSIKQDDFLAVLMEAADPEALRDARLKIMENDTEEVLADIVREHDLFDDIEYDEDMSSVASELDADERAKLTGGTDDAASSQTVATDGGSE